MRFRTSMIALTSLCFLAILVFPPSPAKNAQRSSLPPQGVVPDEATAVKIAEAILPPIFGKKEVDTYSPYHAQLADGIWTVYGSLKPGSRGGTPMIRIR